MNKITYPSIEQMKLLSGSHTIESFETVGKYYCDIFSAGNFYSAKSKILDAGCGVGRIARRLVDQLDKSIGGEYHGFDVASDAITWCSQNISSIYNNFNFKHIDLKNQSYNPNGSIMSVDDIIFDYKENYFDFIFATSLFTHLQQKETEKYLRELHKLAIPGCKLYLTFFTCESIETFSSKHIDDNHIYFQDSDVSWVAYKDKPNRMVIYKLEYLRKLFPNTGFKVVEIPSTCWQTGIVLEKI
jgi:SAM-dependent methyltransferase